MPKLDWIIETGDTVQVGWANDQCVLRGVVRYRPQATGDSWIIQLEDGTPYYIQQFETMFRLKRAGESSDA